MRIPSITTADFCNLKCDYQATLTGTCDVDGNVLVYKYPYTDNKEPIAVGIAFGGTWTVKSSAIEDGCVYTIVGVNYDGQLMELATVSETVCNKECVLIGDFSGEVDDIALGYVYVIDTATNEQVAVGLVKNNRWKINYKLSVLDSFKIFSVKII